MNDFLAPAACYLLPTVYLALLGVPSLSARVPRWTHPVVAVAGLVITAVLCGPWLALASAALAALLFIALVFAGILSRTGTYALPTAAACLPPLAWVALLPGLALAGAVSAIRLRRAAGKGYVSAVTGQTLAATGTLGVTTGTGLIPQKPDLSALPMPLPEPHAERQPAPDAGDSPLRRASAAKVRFPLYLAAGLALAGVLAFLG